MNVTTQIDGIDIPVSYVCFSKPDRSWMGEKVVVYGPNGKLVLRLVGGKTKGFAQWILALQIRIDTKWQNMRFARGSNLSVSRVYLYDAKGNQTGQTSILSDAHLFSNKQQIGRLVYHPFPTRIDIVQNNNLLAKICLVRKKDVNISTEYFNLIMSVKPTSDASSQPIHPDLLFLALMYIDVTRGVGGHSEIVWQDNETVELK